MASFYYLYNKKIPYILEKLNNHTLLLLLHTIKRPAIRRAQS